MRFKVYFSMKQLQARDTNIQGIGDNKIPWSWARLTNGNLVPYTQLMDEKANYKPQWDDAMYLGISYREDVACCDIADYLDRLPIWNIDELEPAEERISCL